MELCVVGSMLFYAKGGLMGWNDYASSSTLKSNRLPTHPSLTGGSRWTGTFTGEVQNRKSLNLWEIGF